VTEDDLLLSLAKQIHQPTTSAGFAAPARLPQR
jgi:hypothetical protein